MTKIATLPQPDKDELHEAQKRQKKEATTEARKEKLKQRDILLQRIPPLPEYESMQIEYRATVNHFPNNFTILPYPMFSLI